MGKSWKHFLLVLEEVKNIQLSQLLFNIALYALARASTQRKKK
jgi:hypothetical protein